MPALKNQLPAYTILIAFIAGGLLNYLFNQYADSSVAIQPTTIEAVAAPETNCDVTSTRVGGYKYIKPLLFADQSCESTRFSAVKSAIGSLVNSSQLSGDVSKVSVYLREFEHGKWMGLNEEEAYHPASLIKVPIMMAILRMADDQPGLLDQEIVYDDIPKEMVRSKQNYVTEVIVPGKKYTVRELLRYMISYSDNNAQLLLVKYLKPTNFDHMFTDMGIGLPMEESTNQILLSAKDYSAFIKTLFNASYLTPSKSEFALSLMKDCSFKDGFIKGLPTDMKVVHKFGEWDDKRDFELHESGVIYILNKAYLLTVMTRGNSREKLPGVIANVTEIIYGELVKLP